VAEANLGDKSKHKKALLFKFENDCDNNKMRGAKVRQTLILRGMRGNNTSEWRRLFSMDEKKKGLTAHKTFRTGPESA
jgi:hypothetical protein